MSKPTEIDAVRQCLTADLPQLDAATLAAARERALRPASGSRGRLLPYPRSWALRVALFGAVAGVVITVAIALGGGGRGATRGPFGVPSAAAAILTRAAAHLAAGSALHGAQARVIREDMLQLVGDQGKDGRTYYYVLPRAMESGFDALGNWFYVELPDGQPRFADPAAAAAYVRAVGPYVPVPPKPRLEQHHGTNTPNPDFLNLSAAQVMALPSDPKALKARLLAQARIIATQGEAHDLVYVASRLLTFGPTPPAVQAALARLLAKLPGVRHVGTASIGREVADVLSFPGGTRLAFDRRTGQLLEEIDVLPHRSPGYPGLRSGTVVDVIAFTTRIAPTIDTRIKVPASMPVGAPTAPATPAVTPPPITHPCRAPLPGYDTDVQVYAVLRSGSAQSVVLQRIKADCEGQGRFGIQPVGAKHAAPLSPTATIQIFGLRAQRLLPATLAQLAYGLSHPAKYGWFDGAVFAVKTNPMGEITGLAELFHP